MPKLISLLFAFGVGLHIYFLQLNQILKDPDGFAYLQMAHFLKKFQLSGFGTGWFGFLYSLFIAPINIIMDFLNLKIIDDNLFFSAQVLNILLFFISGVLLYFIGKIYLNKLYNFLLLALFFTSSALLHFNIGVLSENIYIPLFLALFLLLYNFIYNVNLNNLVNGENTGSYGIFSTIKFVTLIGFFLALLYFTRGEAFIYLGSIFILFLLAFLVKIISFPKFLAYVFSIIVLFFIFISPYIYYLHTITGERGITNKGSSNIRQAELRGLENMDDEGFEKAVGELTEDKKHLLAGFAGGLKYDKPADSIGIIEYINNDRIGFINKFLKNQDKLYSEIIPKMILGDSLKYYSDTSFVFYKNKIILGFLLLPLFLLLYGAYSFLFNGEELFIERKIFVLILFSTFFIASIFFSIFFILERYFIVFLPLFFIVICYGAQNLFLGYQKTLFNYYDEFRLMKFVLILTLFTSIFLVGDLYFFTYGKFEDDKYKLKKEVAIFLRQNNLYKNGEKVLISKDPVAKSDINLDPSELRIMERFPIFTYYIGSKERWLTPWTDNLKDLYKYASYNKIDYLVVDTMDFEKYRKGLEFLLDSETNHKGLSLVKQVVLPGKKVLIYKIKKAFN